MLDGKTLEYIEYRANHCVIKQIIESLINILGIRMTTFLSGRDDASILNSWCNETERPTKLEELRLRYGYWAAAIINVKYDSETARVIFIGMNPVLGDEALVFWLRDHEKEEDLKLVVSAALNDEMCS